jgi:hypothetical protein
MRSRGKLSWLADHQDSPQEKDLMMVDDDRDRHRRATNIIGEQMSLGPCSLLAQLPRRRRQTDPNTEWLTGKGGILKVVSHEEMERDNNRIEQHRYISR